MKIYVLEDNRRCIAISEKKSDLMNYCLFYNIDLSNNEFTVKTYKDKRICDEFLIRYEHLYIEYIYGYPILREDSKFIEEKISDEYTRLSKLIEMLGYGHRHYYLSKADRKSLKDAQKILVNLMSRKNIKSILDIRKILVFHTLVDKKWLKELHDGFDSKL